ncbi:4962_t:CDS:2, partial [Racocetra persica]
VESPRYLISQNKIEEAKETLQKLRKGYNIDLEFEEIIQGQSKKQINAINDVNIEKDEKYIQTSLVDTDDQLGIKKSASFKELLQDSYCRKMLFVCIGTHIVQQLCGIQSHVRKLLLNAMDKHPNHDSKIQHSVLLHVTTFSIALGTLPFFIIS